MKTTGKIAAEQKCHDSTVRRWAAKLGIPKIGRDYLIDPAAEQRILGQLRENVGNPKFLSGNELSLQGVAARKKKKKKKA